MAQHIALIYNLWFMFVRVAIPRRHAEAITSRPFMLTAGGTQTRHEGQTKLTLTSGHAKTGQSNAQCGALGGFSPTVGRLRSSWVGPPCGGRC